MHACMHGWQILLNKLRVCLHVFVFLCVFACDGYVCIIMLRVCEYMHCAVIVAGPLAECTHSLITDDSYCVHKATICVYKVRIVYDS